MLERHPEVVVLVTVPADRGLHDEPPVRHEVERRQLLRQLHRMTQRGDDRAEEQAKGRRPGGDGRGEHDRVRPWRLGVLVTRHRVRPPVGLAAARPGTRSQGEMIAQHHAVDADPLGDDGPLDERGQVLTIDDRLVLGEDQHDPRVRHEHHLESFGTE